MAKENKNKNDKKIKEFPKFLQFKHRKFAKKTREYQHEIGHLTSDLLTINQKIQRSLALCQFVINTIGKPDVGYRISRPKDLEIFEELLYHIENFIFRVFAYRDKLALFLNFIFGAPYEEGEMNLIKKFTTYKESKKYHIDTELNKFYESPIKDIFEKRKAMTHRIYYKEYNPYFFPNITPQQVGLRKATIIWRKKVVEEAQKIDECLIKIFDINVNLTKKLKKYLTDQ